jgi:hypothetical protein
MTKRKKARPDPGAKDGRQRKPRFWLLPAAAVVAALAVALWFFTSRAPSPSAVPARASAPPQSAPEITGWIERARAVSRQFHRVYTPCWEGAYGAIGDAYLFAATGDSSLLRFHLIENDLRSMCEGTWVDDRAWVCLAELKWWEVTGRKNSALIDDARRRYDEARLEGRLSRHEGFVTWYNWPPGSGRNERVFTNSNMNQMATAACGIYLATGNKTYLREALLVWEGEGKTPGIEKQWYRGNGVWEGRHGKAAFGKELPWNGLGCVPLASALYRATGRKKYKEIAVETVKRMLDPRTGWVDPDDYYQLHMDGNGVFVNALFDGFAIAPDELAEVPLKVRRMLEHVWTNHQGRATVTLHRVADHAIRNGWNPEGGEDGYGVGEVGTVHAQGEAARAFGIFAYYAGRRLDS